MAMTDTGAQPLVSTNDMGDVIDTTSGDKVKFGRNDEAGAAAYAAELSKLGQGKFEPYYETKGFNHYAIRKTGESITGTSQTTGGATGGQLNTESQMLAASGANGGGGGVVVGGSTQVNNSSSVQHNAADENSGVSDKTVGNNLYD